MKLWTIQPVEWYEKLLSDGIIYGEEHLIDFIKDDDFKNAYHWMIKKMEEKIGNRPFKNAYPIWAWYQYSNINKRKPDLRNGGLLTKGTKGVRIEFKKNEKDVLLSDFTLWTHPINFWNITDNKNDDDDFDKLLEKENIKFNELTRYNAPKYIREKIEKSWDKVLDMEYCPEYSAHPFESKSIQATFWSLSKEEIINVDFFISKQFLNYTNSYI